MGPGGTAGHGTFQAPQRITVTRHGRMEDRMVFRHKGNALRAQWVLPAQTPSTASTHGHRRSHCSPPSPELSSRDPQSLPSQDGSQQASVCTVYQARWIITAQDCTAGDPGPSGEQKTGHHQWHGRLVSLSSGELELVRCWKWSLGDDEEHRSDKHQLTATPPRDGAEGNKGEPLGTRCPAGETGLLSCQCV